MKSAKAEPINFAENDNNFSGIQKSGTHVKLTRSEREMRSLSRRHLMNWPSRKTWPRFKLP